MNRFLSVLICLLAGIIVVSGCAGTPSGRSGGNAVLSEGVMTTSVDDDSKPTGEIKTNFPADTPAVYCSFKVEGVVPEDMIKASLIHVKGSEGAEESIIYETYMIAESKEPSYYLAFYFDKPASGWSRGDYKIVISVNNVNKLSIPFKIE